MCVCVCVTAPSSQAIYESFGGGQKGISLKDLVCGLVLLSYGSQHEKARCKLYTDIAMVTLSVCSHWSVGVRRE